ncbi:hypothetical protein ACEWY4_008132 [Coilia grayii]|uniref:G-protein coupled receptors family 1 profile domain-containing protein n=1 Tax=Coilia grayii TaxID=363190 RepID=A0ABD1K9Y7_9TELE
MDNYRPGNNTGDVFYLTGFANLREHRRLLSIPFFFLLLYMMAANAVVTYVIAKQRNLYKPMYVLIGSLTLLNFFFPLLFIPRMVVSFASGRNEITAVECLLQIFVIHLCGSFQTSILLQMAVDRFFAICWPLRYHDIVNLRNSILFTAALALRNTVTMVTMVCLFIPLTFCQSNVIYHCACVVTLACGTSLRSYIAGVMAFTITTSDCIIIAATYVVIFIVIFWSSSGESRQKAIHTCSTHLLVIGISYLSVVCAFIGYKVSAIPPDIKVALTLSYLLIPSCFSPVIYGIRTNEIKVYMLKMLKLNTVDSKNT